MQLECLPNVFAINSNFCQFANIFKDLLKSVLFVCCQGHNNWGKFNNVCENYHKFFCEKFAWHAFFSRLKINNLKHLVNMFLTLLVDNAFLKPIYLEETISLPIKLSCGKRTFLMRLSMHYFAVPTHTGWPLINKAHYTRYARLSQCANQVQQVKLCVSRFIAVT